MLQDEKVIKGIQTTLDDKTQEILINAEYWEGHNVADLKTIGGKSIFKTTEDDENNIEIHTNSILDITYSELKTLRDNSELQTGTQYRITDYVTTTTQGNTMSANHPFEIIVSATSTNMLSEFAIACWIKRTNRIEIIEETTPSEWINVEVDDIPEELKNKLGFTPDKNTDVKYFTTLVTLNEGELDVEFKFKPGSGTWKINCVGVDVVKINENNEEEVVSYDYHIGYTGDNHVNNSYDLTVTECGEYKIRYFVDNRSEGINATSYITSVNVSVLDYDYFDNLGLSAWEIKYCLDNDTNRFAWADTENGKGVIYYMKDEYGNECPYDFKNIMFKRDSDWMKEHKSNFSDLSSFTDDELWFYTFSRISDDTISDDSINKDLSNKIKPCKNNIIHSYSKHAKNGNVTYLLNNNIFIGNGANSNHFGENSCDNTFTGIFNNYFDLGCQKNIAYKTLSENHIGINFKNNTITNDFKFNNINNDCDSNTFGYFCYCNVKNNFKYNRLNYFESCTIGDGFTYNNSILSNSIKYCDFGNYIQKCNDLPSMTNIVFDNEVVKNSDEGKGLTDIVLSNGENALDAISNLSSNTSKVLFTKKDDVYYLIDIVQNVGEFEGKLECIYDLGRFSTNAVGENAAFNIDIIRNPKILYLKFYNIEKQKNIYIKQFIYNHNCSNGEYGYAKQYMYLDGITFCRKCWFKNGENGYETVNNSEYNSGWSTFEDRDGSLYSGGIKVVTRNDSDVFVKLSDNQTISGIKRFNSNINIAGKTIIRSDINNGELKVFKPEVSGSTDEGFTIRTNEKFENNIPKLELLATNNYASYKYQFPKLKNENDTDYVVVNSQLADYAKASDLNDVIEEVKENEKVTAVALNNLNEISENIKNISNSLNVYYSELVELRNTSSLVPGQQYRIIDYVTTTTQTDTESAGHMFDIIVTADDNSTLNEVARAGYSSVDHYFNDYNAKLEAWKIWYCLDNDKKRFGWADEENGKGVIYRMIDEWNNDCPYDFKNIKFKRNISIDDLGIYYISAIIGTETYCYTFSIVSNHISDLADNSICGNDNENNRINVYSNVIGRTNEERSQKLNNNVFFNDFTSEKCYCNILSMECSGNSFGRGSFANSFGERCTNNIFGNNCYGNILGNYSSNNKIGFGCYGNTFGFACVENVLGNNCSYNVFGDNCNKNELYENCDYNTFDNYCRTNKLKNNSGHNTFGNNCYTNELGEDCYYNTYGNSSHGNGLLSDCCYNKFGNNCDINKLYASCCHNILGDNCTNNILGQQCSSNVIDDNCKYNLFGSGSTGPLPNLKGIHYFNNVSYTQLGYIYNKSDIDNLVIYPNVSGTSDSSLFLRISQKNTSIALKSDGSIYVFNLGDKLSKIT